ncbi:MAG: glycerol-3-phosphate dehydrogenase/oxidase [Cyclobacteriaceae bacterium]
MEFSFFYREEMITEAKQTDFDLLVIGGGITGTGIALDAALRGHKVLLVEKNDFAYGTSSRSTKLIHGGLRYLKQLEFALVKEVGSERAIVHKLAPHLVIPEKMLLPLREKRGYGSLLTSFGLKLYDWLAGVTGKDRRLMLTRRQTLRREPLLKKDDVKGGALYAEYRTDDARLTIEVAKKAFAHGALVLNYCKAERFEYENGKVAGAVIRDVLNEKNFTVKAKVIVNAAGPWVDTLRKEDGSLQGKRLHLTKGVHIVVPRDRLPIRQAIYFDVAEDSRMIFAIPRGDKTYIGTTDTNYSDDIDGVQTSREDAEYLIRGVNESFPGADLKLRDIESSWAGLRPLIHEEGKSASELSRKDEIFESESGLISMAGGKLTGYRKMAERVVNLVEKKYLPPFKVKGSLTVGARLGDGAFINYKSVRKYLLALKKRFRRIGLDESHAHYLVNTYGKQSDLIMERFNESDEPVLELRLLLAELWFAVHYEMVGSVQDFLIRRTGRLYFDIHSVRTFGKDVVDQMANYLKWSEAKRDSEFVALEEAIHRCVVFKQ